MTTFRVGLLGAGYIADWHVKALRTVPGTEVVAVCDLNRDRVDAFARAHGIPQSFARLDDLLDAGGLDAVHVLLPPPAHAAAARSILDAGLAVYVEKPLAITPDDCRELADRAASGAHIGVGHNFLFDPAYEKLRDDLAAGRLGRVEHVEVVWAKEFGPVRGGPFGQWVLRDPANVLLEVGPHAAVDLLDLLGPPDRLSAEALDPVLLPGGVKFYRRWLVRLHHGRASADVRLSFGEGYPEHRIEVRGSAGTATADLDRGTYVLRRRTHLPTDFDRYARTTGEARALARQARRNLARYALTKAKLATDGNAFGHSIARALRRFYANPPAVGDNRLSAAFGARVVQTCLDIAAAAGLDRASDRPAPAPMPAPAKPEVLVLGGSGFIGRALVRRLAADGRRVRVLARDPGSVPDDLRAGSVEVCRGDLTRPDDLARALDGAPAVVHLARAHARTWDEYLRNDVEVTKSVAAACLRAGVGRLIYTGTTDCYYSGRDETITEDTPLDPKVHRRSLYCRAKAEGERVLRELARDRGLSLVVARPAVVVGPGGDPHHWGLGFWSSPEACRFYGDGLNPVPLVLVEDVADALARCLDADVIGEAFNLAAESVVTPREYVAALGEALGTWIDARPHPAWRYFAADVGKWVVKCAVRHPERRMPSYRDWASRTYRARYDCAKARRLLGWKPTSDRDGLLDRGIRQAAAAWAA